MAARKRMTQAERAERDRAQDLLMQQYGEAARQQGAIHVVGVDEVGRGPVAGPIVAAAVELDPTKPIAGLRDSKKLTPKKREQLCAEIEQSALQISVQWIDAARIDDWGIAEANRRALNLAVQGLKIQPDWVLADYFALDEGSWVCQALVHGDACAQEIAAASILAKVYRDRYMVQLEQRYPGYGFASHKGYGTAAHRKALQEFGLTPEHRRSFLTKWVELL